MRNTQLAGNATRNEGFKTMYDQQDFLKLMVSLKAVEAELKCALLSTPMPEHLLNTCRRDKVELATKRLHEVVKGIDEKFWKEIEKER